LNLTIDWAHRDAIPLGIFCQGRAGRVLVMSGLGDNVRVLHLVKPADHIIVFTVGDYGRETYEMMTRVLHTFELERAKVTVLCNEPAQVEWARSVGLEAFFCNKNAFINEAVFRAAPMEKCFDAVSNARLVKLKRVHLARLVPNLALICGHRLEQTEYDDPGEIPHAYINENRLAPRGVVRVLSASRVGLALSAAEGACQASSEYLLCGLPVVSTPSRGGRDIWYDDDNSIISEPQPEAVRDAVLELVARRNRGGVDPERIRGRHIALAQEHRACFVRVLERAFDDVRAAVDPRMHFESRFESPGIAPRYTPYAEVVRQLGEAS